MTAKVYNIFGLSYGDEGKGTTVESLVKRYDATAVIRYNGGPQAAHHVVENGHFHCFSQFGSGTLVPGVKTHLAEGMIVKPSNLLIEAEQLQRIGVSDALSRITISPSCYIVTPWHAMIGQMLEAARGNLKHGSVGMGVGQASFDRTEHPDSSLTVRDLSSPSALWTKIQEHYRQKIAVAQTIIEANPSEEVVSIFQAFLRNISPVKLFQEYLEFTGALDGAFQPDEVVFNRLAKDKAIVLEGAQEVLLDPVIGFTPHVTKTRVIPSTANRIIESLGALSSIVNIGVTRCFATRHGAGPFVTAENLPHLEAGEHNQQNRWQDSFRYGYFDLVTSRYSVKSSGEPVFLSVTCLDRFDGQDSPRVCRSYEYCGEEEDKLNHYFSCGVSNGRVEITGIKHLPGITQKQSEERTKMLLGCKPLDFQEFEGWPQARQKGTLHPNAQAFLEFLESDKGLGIPVAIASVGNKSDNKLHLLDT